MTGMPRLFTLVALAASAIPFASATSCPSSHFPYSGALDLNLCISIGGNDSSKGTAPSGKSCPSDWFWHTGSSCCVPSTPSYSPTPSCSGKSLWSPSEQCCSSSGAGGSPPTSSKLAPPPTTSSKPAPSPPASSCSNNEFPWTGKKGACCLPNGGPGSSPSPPSGSSCPSSWYWHSDQGCCVPKTPSAPSPPSCPSKYSWNGWQCSPSGSQTTTSSQPTSTSSDDCGDNEFLWYGLQGKCCIPHGGNPSPPAPPAGSSCPSNQGWYWHSGQGCCVPSHPSPPTPTCPSNSWWGNQCCNNNPPPPKPSGHYGGYKRQQKKRSTGLCPIGLEACPVGAFGGLTADYECIDTTQELQSCGGCASLHPELDCTAIEGSWNVGCERGACKVYSCQPGYKLTRDGASCAKMQ